MTWKILAGDCRDTLKTLEAGSVHCCVTSPPYFQQRDYGVVGQIGRELTVAEYVEQLVLVFRELRRVLRDDGTFFLNLGDKYIDKQLQGVPWRTALALQADGWVLRSDIIWHRVNAMPGSQRDRFTCDHEYLFMFSKSKEYYFDLEASRLPANGRVASVTGVQIDRENVDLEGWMATRRSVWAIPVAAERESHFAAFPQALVLPCVLSGTSERGCCDKCGAPFIRQVERIRTPTRPGTDTKVIGDSEREGNRDPERHITEARTIGWAASCQCGSGIKPCLVIDPFLGTGTTMAVAVSKNRDAVGCELNSEYIEIIKRKMSKAEITKGFGL